MVFYLIYILSIPVGLLLTSYFLRKNKQKYFWYDYMAIFILPFFTLYLLFRSVGVMVIFVFGFWVIFGPLLEALFGWTYRFIRAGKRLWIYERYPLFGKTTSWLSIPFWAFAGSGIWATNQLLTQLLK